MCANKADENMTNSKFYHNHKTIFVTSNVKHIVLVSNIIG